MTSGAAAGTHARLESGPRLAFRPARTDELAACADVWRLSIDDYVGRLNQPPLPIENASLVRLYAHLRTTDPERFVVATVPATDAAAGIDAPTGERVVAFASAVVRERLWYLSMLFVLPELQSTGVGRALLREVAPPPGIDVARATATDTAQPISNALYASLGIVPRAPLLNLVGLPERAEAFGLLPDGVHAVPFGDDSGTRRDDSQPAGSGAAAGPVDELDALDRAVLGVAHPADHAFVRAEGRRGWAYRGPAGELLGYGYAGEVGRVGPVAVRDADLVAPILGHLMTAVRPRGAFAVWLPGNADRALTAALRSGLRLEPFPVLLCWDRPFVDLARYLPTSPGLL